MSYIRYITKPNGVEYAFLVNTIRDGEKIKQKYIENIGKVINKDEGIFQSKKRGVFQYTPENGFNDLQGFYPEINSHDEKEKLILDFGDAYFLDQYVKKLTFYTAFQCILPDQTDTLFSMLFYRILTDKKANCYAQTWWEGNYTRILFQKARLTSQRISEFLSALGAEDVQREFFKQYFHAVYGDSRAVGVLIDSSGLPNATKMSLTQISNHNGDISLEARLIYVIDRVTGLPIYFRYCPGNIIDVTTLCTTIAELCQYGVNVDYAIVDTGYFSEANVKELYKSNVRFVTRLAPNRKLFKEVATKHLKGLLCSKYAVRYGNRLLYVEKVPTDVYGNQGFAYIGIDIDSRNQQMKRAAFTFMDDQLTAEESDDRMAKLGVFMIISSEDICVDDILPLYYTRQQIEQVFDIGKNEADLLPLRIQNEDTFRGHLMLTFLATAVLQNLQQDIIKKRKKKDKINPEGALLTLRNQKCKVYEKVVIPQEPVKAVNDIYKIFAIESFVTILRDL